MKHVPCSDPPVFRTRLLRIGLLEENLLCLSALGSEIADVCAEQIAPEGVLRAKRRPYVTVTLSYANTYPESRYLPLAIER